MFYSLLRDKFRMFPNLTSETPQNCIQKKLNTVHVEWVINTDCKDKDSKAEKKCKFDKILIK